MAATGVTRTRPICMTNLRMMGAGMRRFDGGTSAGECIFAPRASNDNHHDPVLRKNPLTNRRDVYNLRKLP